MTPRHCPFGALRHNEPCWEGPTKKWRKHFRCWRTRDRNKGQHEQAEASACEALNTRQRLTGNEHGGVASSLDQLAGILEDRGQYKEAETRAEEALAIRRRLLGPRNEKVADSLKTLAEIVGNGSAHFARTGTLIREELDILRSIHGGDNVKVAVALNDLAVNCLRTDDYAQAESLYREALAIQVRVLGDEHPEVASTLENLGGMLLPNRAIRRNPPAA